MLIRNVKEIQKIWTPQHGKGTLYQVFFGMPSTHKMLGIPPKPFAVTKIITSFWIMTIEPGATNPVHIHEDVEQVYLILEGEGAVLVGDEEAKLRKGDAVFLPDRISHGFRNDSDEPCVILAVGAKVTPPESERKLPRFIDYP